MAADEKSNVALAFDKIIDMLSRQIDDVTSGKDFEAGDGVMAVTRLTGALTKVVAEKRKLEKMEGAAIRELTQAVIVTWAKMQTPEQRAKLVREVVAIDDRNRKSVLG